MNLPYVEITFRDHEWVATLPEGTVIRAPNKELLERILDNLYSVDTLTHICEEGGESCRCSA